MQALGLLALLVVLNVPVWHEFTKITTAVARGHLPWLNAWCGVALLLTCARLAHGRRSPVLSWAGIGQRVLSILVLVRLLLGAPLLGTNPAGPVLQALGLAPLPARQLSLMNQMLMVALVGALIGLVGGTLQGLASLLQGSSLDAWDISRAGRYFLGIALGLCLAAPLALLLGNVAYIGPGLPLGLVLGAVLDRYRERVLA